MASLISEVKEKFMSCTSERSLSCSFNIFWAVMLYCKLFNKELNEIEDFITQFSTKALHMGYAAMMSSVVIHHGCFCKYCKIRDQCQKILIRRGKTGGPDEYYPTTIDSVDSWAPDNNKPLPYFNLYFDLTSH